MSWSVMSIDRCSLIAPIFSGGADTWRLADVRSAKATTAKDAATTVLRILHLRELGVAADLRDAEGITRRQAAAKPPPTGVSSGTRHSARLPILDVQLGDTRELPHVVRDEHRAMHT